MGVQIISIETASASFSFNAYGGDMIVLAAGGSAQASQISAATFNGVALTRQINKATTYAACSIWTLVNPYQGSATFAITGNPGTMRAFLLRNAKLVNGTGSASGLSTAVSTSISCARSDLLIDAAGSDNNRTWTPQAAQTQVVGGAATVTGISYKLATALTDSMSWTLSISENWVQSVIAISPKQRRGMIFI